jgi:hypothetical protein
MNASFYRSIILVFFCLVMAVPAPATGSTAKAAKGESQEELLTRTLHQFGVQIAEAYNRNVNGSKAKKDTRKNADGTYTAIYYEIDLNSIAGTYKESSNPKGPVKYIGTLTYAEVRYVNTAPTRAEAEQGPFLQSRSTTTELVKYVRGKWSY